MNRHGARELVLHLLYTGEYTGMTGEQLLESVNEERFRSLEQEYSLYRELPPKRQQDYVHDAVTGVMAHLPELDGYIEKYAVGWNVGRISRVSKCILRLSMYELLYLGIPKAASVNEALELAKEYDSPEAAGFINGILAAFIQQEVSL